MKRMTRLLLKLFMLTATFWVAACNDPEPIKIGFVGGLSGRSSDLGREGRDGVLLAVELANKNGGVSGRPIELLIRDDGQNKTVAKIVNQELLEAGVAAVVGHMTSAMSMVGADQYTAAKIPLISPTTSTNALHKKDDYFFRIYPSSWETAQQLAAWVAKGDDTTEGIETMVVLYDTNNQSHTESWLNAFKFHYNIHNGRVVKAVAFDSSESLTHAEAFSLALSSQSEGVFVIASAIDASLIIQNLRKHGDQRAIYVSEWSATANFLRYGGLAVEGVKYLSTIDETSKSVSYQRFVEQFENRFQYSPGFAAVHAADTVRFLLSALEKSVSSGTLKQNLLAQEQFAGMQRTFSLNEFGDVQGELFKMVVKDGHFVSAGK